MRRAVRVRLAAAAEETAGGTRERRASHRSGARASRRSRSSSPPRQAHDALGDERKRELYDRYGEEGLEEGGGGGGPGDIFDVLSGRGRGGRQQSRVKKGEPMVHPLKARRSAGRRQVPRRPSPQLWGACG